MNQRDAFVDSLSWRNSDHICALSDSERHIGHVVRMGGRWHAFDATQSSKSGDSFLELGTFVAVEAAKTAVEQSFRSIGLPYAGAA